MLADTAPTGELGCSAKEERMRRWGGTLLAWFFVAIALAGCGRGSTPGLDAPEHSTPGLDAPEQLTLYSIDGRDVEPGKQPKAEEEFHGYPVLGKIEVTDAGKRKEIIDALKQGLAASDGKTAQCFWPRHAIRTIEQGRTTDYAICFECWQLAIYEGGTRRIKPVTRDPQAVFNRHLTVAGIPLAPGKFGEGK
jgi:hypothetical protein